VTARNGPPDKRDKGRGPAPAANEDNRSSTNNTTTSTDQSTADTKRIRDSECSCAYGACVCEWYADWAVGDWDHPQDALSQLRRRREAALRSMPLNCGCRDPWTCRCRDDRAEFTERHVDGYVSAVLHLLDKGLMPAPNLPAMRLMYRRGGRDRRIASEIAERWGTAA
jgi:hypothetical protein